jgi:ABC-2 type transport system ATP-binding protein
MELVINGLSKTYANGVKALDNVTLTIPTGMFGLLGPNGAGKSSLMRILATLQEADAGTVMLGNIDVLRQKDEVRKVLGYLPQEFGVYPRVSAYQMLDHIALLKGVINKGPAEGPRGSAAAESEPVGAPQAPHRRIQRRHETALRDRPIADR